MDNFEKALYLLAGEKATCSRFFSAASYALRLGLDYRWAGIAIVEDDRQRADVVAFCDYDEAVKPFSFPLIDTPCKEVYANVSTQPCLFYQQAAERFPKSPLLHRLGAQTYRGAAFFDHRGKPIGHIFSMDDGVRQDQPSANALMQLISRRVGAEYERWRNEEMLERYQTIFSSSKDMVSLIDTDYRYQAVNQCFADAFTKPQDDIILHTVSDLHGNAFFSKIKPLIDKSLSGKEVRFRARIKTNGAKLRFLDCLFSPHRNSAGDISGSIFCSRDISDIYHLSQRLNHRASHDFLTGLVNRHEFELRLQRILRERSAATLNHTLCFMDLDQFKIVNDTVGHSAGDQLLQQVAHLLRSKIRGGDTLARLGGDEFGLLLEECSLENAFNIAGSLVDAIKNYRFIWNDRPFEIGISIGLVVIDGSETVAADLLSHADMACYAAKERGRNRVHVYLPNDTELAKRQNELLLVTDLREALNANSFQLYFQPIVPLTQQHNADTHYEVLLRLVNKQGKITAPGEFIPVAERYDLMNAIDRWVVQKVLSNYRGLFGEHKVRIAINLSGNSFNDESLLDFVQSCLIAANIEATALCFEITETAAINNLSQALQFINSMRRLGCKFALDDFGSGVSSFAYLKKLPIDYLKIDRGFVQNMISDAGDHAMVTAINQIGHVMDIRTIAEGVEDIITLKVLRELRVDYAQGYALGKPAPMPT